MKVTRSAGIALALVCSAAFLSAQAAADHKADEKKPAAAAPAMDEKAMMEMMAKAATPGAEHQKLASMAGTWDTKVKAWMNPAAPPAESSGTTKAEMVMGGRYLQQSFEGEFMGKPFHGMGMSGYDNVTKKYWGTWVDDMGTGVMTSTGHMDKGGKSMTYSGQAPDPTTGKMAANKTKVIFTDADHYSFEMWAAGPDGKQTKVMEIAYSRTK